MMDGLPTAGTILREVAVRMDVVLVLVAPRQASSTTLITKTKMTRLVHLAARPQASQALLQTLGPALTTMI